MAFAAAIGGIISGVASAAGGMASASAYERQAEQMRLMRNWNWERRMEQAAIKQSEGAVAYAEKQREGELAKGQARAAVAEGGGSTTSSGGLRLMQDFTKRIRYLSETEQFKYLDEERNIRNQAKADWYEANIQIEAAETRATAARIGAIGGLASGIGGALKGFG